MKGNKLPLTEPSKIVKNDCDNIDGDLIVYQGDIFYGKKDNYEAIDQIGKGTYGQVIKCKNIKTNKLYAVKISKIDIQFKNCAVKESLILYNLNQLDQDLFPILKEEIYFKGHHLIVLELLSMNLYEFLKINNFEGLEHWAVRKILIQVLKGLEILKRVGFVHCDIKPENILLFNENFDVKIIDFGASFHITDQCDNFYVQSRYYRAPEVLCKFPCINNVDMWSLGCVAYELLTGRPLFPGSDNDEQLERINTFINGDDYEISVDYVMKDKVIKNRKISEGRIFAEKKKTFLKKIDLERDVSFKGSSNETKYFIDFLLKTLEFKSFLRPSPIEMLAHPYLIKEDVPIGGMTASKAKIINEEHDRSMNPPPFKNETKAISSNFNSNLNMKKMRRWTSMNKNKKEEE